MSPRQLAHGLSALSLVAMASVGCGGTPDEGEAIGISAQHIKGGYEDPSDTAVVGIYDAQADALCSGSLIGPNLVLTARHCVSNTQNETPEGGVYCPKTTAGVLHSASQFFVTTQPYFTMNAQDYHTVREVIGLPVDTALFCGNDQAILILNDNVAPEQAFPYVPRVDEPLAVGEEYYAIGYGGVTDTGAGAGQRRRRDQLYISCVADTCPADYVKPTEFVGDTGICSGDSGGPAIDMQNRVIGVTSRGATGCDSPVYGYVFGWGQWIKDVANYAASLGGYPPPPWAGGYPTDPAYSYPVGDACAVPADCVSNQCIADGQGTYCTRQCKAEAPCPDGFTCDEAGLGVCVMNAPPATTTKKKKGNAAEDDGGCSIRRGDDPTKPIPWKGATLALGLAVLAARRRRR